MYQKIMELCQKLLLKFKQIWHFFNGKKTYIGIIGKIVLIKYGSPNWPYYETLSYLCDIFMYGGGAHKFKKLYNSRLRNKRNNYEKN